MQIPKLPDKSKSVSYSVFRIVSEIYCASICFSSLTSISTLQGGKVISSQNAEFIEWKHLLMSASKLVKGDHL